MSTGFTRLAGQYAEALEEQQREQEQREQIDYKMVTFSLAGKDYGVDIMKVKEIAKFSDFTFVPNTPPFVRGVYNLRGDIISLIDLRTMFSLPAEEKPQGVPEDGLILRLQDRLLGIIVDSIDKVVGIDSTTIQPPHPIFGDINIKYISGVVEYNERLYIILDVDRVFAKDSETATLSQRHTLHPDTSQRGVPGRGAAASPEKPGAPPGAGETGEHGETVPQETPPGAPAPERGAATSEARYPGPGTDESEARELDFVTETLATHGAFYPSDLNMAWVRTRFPEWRKNRVSRNKSVQFEDQSDALEYLEPFYSPYTNQFWGQDYIRAVSSVLPSDRTNSINVWNPGCGRGFETYSFAVVLRKTYPQARLKIWANDRDLLSISTAPNLLFSLEGLPDYYRDYVVQGSSGHTFSSEIKDLIVFEYHDVLHTHSLPDMDIILARDLLSFLEPENQERVGAGFIEKLKPGGIIIPGEKEDLSTFRNIERVEGPLNAYRKVS